jgi:Flp pilus assembly protein TadD
VVRGKGRFEVDVEDAPAEWCEEMRAKTVTEPPIKAARRLADARELAHAEAVLTALLEGEPDNVAALDLLGFVLFSQGRVAEAELVCRRTLEILPDHPYALKGLGNCLAQLGKTDDAVASLRKAIALEPTWFDPYNDLFFALVRAGRKDEALETIVRGENEVPGCSAAFARLRKALHEDAPA